MRQLLCITLVCAAAVACKPQANVEKPAVDSSAHQPNAGAAGDPAAPSHKENRMGLTGVLEVLSGSRQLTWTAFDSIKEVSWSDPAPVKNDDVRSADEQYSRAGKITLSGYDSTNVPDGHVGADAGSHVANEGESGFTLNGSKDAVISVTIMKFGQDGDYSGVIAKQLGDTYSIKPLTAQCKYEYGTKADNESQNSFYILAPKSGAPVYAELAQQDGGNSGPGYTLLTFYHKEPADRITAMGCQRM